MRNPRRWRNIALATFVSGTVVTTLSVLLLPAVAADALREAARVAVHFREDLRMIE